MNKNYMMSVAQKNPDYNIYISASACVNIVFLQ